MKSPTAHPWRTLGVLCLAVLMVVIDNTIVNVALPTFSRNLHATNSALQWIVDGYSLPFAALMLAGGGLADRIGRKRVMTGALLAFGLFSLGAAFSTSVNTLLTARALMGVAAAFIFPATLSILTVAFEDPRKRAAAFGIWGATAGIAVAVGPIAGGELISHFWYGSVFLVNVPFCILTVLAVITVIPESKNPMQRRVDVGGLVLGTLAVAGLTWAIIEGPSWGWLSGATLALFGASAIMLCAFVHYELRREGPLLDVRIFRNPHFSAGALSLMMNFFLLFGFIFLVTQYFQLVRGYSPLSAGVRTLPFAIVTMITTPLGALLASKVGAKYVVPIGLVIMSSGLAWIGSLGVHAAYVGPVMGSMMVLAFGFSLISAPSTGVTMSTLAPEQVGAGAAVNETVRELGGTLGVAVIGSVFASLFGPAVRRAFAPFVGHGLTKALALEAQGSTQGAQLVAQHFPAALRPHVLSQVTSAFMHGFQHACWTAALSGVAIALIVVWALPKGPLEQTGH
jgi:MFS transporter, DHA2 family, multidrug resistance protein